MRSDSMARSFVLVALVGYKDHKYICGGESRDLPAHANVDFSIEGAITNMLPPRPVDDLLLAEAAIGP